MRALSLLLSTVICLAQPAAELLRFEVATVKPSTRGDRGPELEGGPDSRDRKEYFTAKGATLYNLLGLAYGTADLDQISGPSWIRSEAYALEAKMPSGTTKAQFQQMLQNLLTERFNLKLHHETKTLPVYELTVLKGGHKLRTPGGPAPLASDGTPLADLPAEKPGYRFNGARLVARQQPVSALVSSLRSAVGLRLIVDKTGLTGIYDYWLDYDPRSTSGDLNIFNALETQLGLRLTDTKAPFDVVVVDSGDKIPTEN